MTPHDLYVSSIVNLIMFESIIYQFFFFSQYFRTKSPIKRDPLNTGGTAYSAFMTGLYFIISVIIIVNNDPCCYASPERISHAHRFLPYAGFCLGGHVKRPNRTMGSFTADVYYSDGVAAFVSFDFIREHLPAVI